MPRICVVGAGRWGQNHVRTLSELGHLAALVDSNADTLAAFREKYDGLTTHLTLDEALAANYDGFVVATPAVTHHKIASAILEQGTPALVEKPLALTVADAQSLVDLAAQKNTNLMVGHLLLFHPAILKIKELIDEGMLGKLQYIYSNRLNLGTVRTEENILWSFAPHDISIFHFLLGTSPIAVESKGAAFLQPGVQDSTMTTLMYPDNVMCHNFVSWVHPFKEHRIVVIGSKGMLTFEDSAGGRSLSFYEKGIDWVGGEPVKRDGEIREIPIGDKMPLTEELRYFSDNLRNPIDRSDGRSAVEVLKVLQWASDALDGSDAKDDTPPTQVDATAFVHPTGVVDDGVQIGPNTKIWHYSHVQSGSRIGARCSLGQSVNVGNNVVIGSDVKIQNNVSVFEGVEIEDYVFCGPSMTFTNVLQPRAKYPQGSAGYSRTLVREGASMGAHVTIVCGNTVGRHAFIAAGALVTKDVPDYAFMMGVPAKQSGWVTEGGERIAADFEGQYQCSISGIVYEIKGDALVEVPRT